MLGPIRETAAIAWWGELCCMVLHARNEEIFGILRLGNAGECECIVWRWLMKS